LNLSIWNNNYDDNDNDNYGAIGINMLVVINSVTDAVPAPDSITVATVAVEIVMILKNDLTVIRVVATNV